MKRGAINHIEVVIAFILFIVAVWAAVYFFYPSDRNASSDSTLSYTVKQIIADSESSVDFYSIEVTTQGKLTFDLSESDLSGALRAESYLGQKISSSLDSGSKSAFIDGNSQNIIRIIAGDGSSFDSSSDSVTGETAGNFIILSSFEKKELSEKKINVLVKEYSRDYNNLKDELKLSKDNNFAFSLVFSADDRIDSGGKIPSGVDIFSKTQRISVIRTDGKIEYADLVVKVW